MASSKKQKREEKTGKEREKPRSNGVTESNARNKSNASADGLMKTNAKKRQRRSKVNDGAVEEPVVYEISDNSSGESEGGRESIHRSNGRSNNQNVKSGVTPKKRRRNDEDEDEEEEEEEDGGGGGLKDAKLFRFPMNRIRRIMKSEDVDSQMMQEAVFLVNKATEMFIERFSEDAYECSIQDKKKFIHYKHISSVVSDEKRYEFLSDYVPEKLKAEDALEQWKSNSTDAG